MKEFFDKYKHYLLIVFALIIADYCLVPLYNEIESKQQSLHLSQKRLLKTEAVIEQIESIEAQEIAILQSKEKAQGLLFKNVNESQFKLLAQEKIESLLQQSGCELSSTAWKGSKLLNDDIAEWRIEVRFQANPSCLVTVTRNFESSLPLIRIHEYSYGGRKLHASPMEQLRGILTLKLWQDRGLA